MCLFILCLLSLSGEVQRLKLTGVTLKLVIFVFLNTILVKY